MKYKTLLAFALVAALGFTTCSVFAEELGAKPVNQENTEVLFGDLNDNDKVVELEDGGFLYGEATVTDENDPTFEPVEYNSFDDPNSITVKDAKKKLAQVFIFQKMCWKMKLMFCHSVVQKELFLTMMPYIIMVWLIENLLCIVLQFIVDIILLL